MFGLLQRSDDDDDESFVDDSVGGTTERWSHVLQLHPLHGHQAHLGTGEL